MATSKTEEVKVKRVAVMMTESDLDDAIRDWLQKHRLWLDHPQSFTYTVIDDPNWNIPRGLDVVMSVETTVLKTKKK